MALKCQREAESALELVTELTQGDADKSDCGDCEMCLTIVLK